MRFSQRKGVVPVRVELQRESIDQPLRNKIWTVVSITFFATKNDYYAGTDYEMPYVSVQRLWIHFFREPLDQIRDWDRFKDQVRALVLQKWTWYEVYDFLEAIAVEMGRERKELLFQFTRTLNDFLESEMSAYRLVGEEIAEITNEQEIAAIEDALTETSPLSPVHLHLRTALAKLTDRDHPDFRNSIKESISAVEALCRLITGDSKTTLGQALKKLDASGVSIHAALKDAWLKIYGYTSDQGGIRHALADDKDPDFAAAKYMLVSCSAFTSYLMVLAEENGIRLGSAPTQ